MLYHGAKGIENYTMELKFIMIRIVSMEGFILYINVAYLSGDKGALQKIV